MEFISDYLNGLYEATQSIKCNLGEWTAQIVCAVAVTAAGAALNAGHEVMKHVSRNIIFIWNDIQLKLLRRADISFLNMTFLGP